MGTKIRVSSDNTTPCSPIPTEPCSQPTGSLSKPLLSPLTQTHPLPPLRSGAAPRGERDRDQVFAAAVQVPTPEAQGSAVAEGAGLTRDQAVARVAEAIAAVGCFAIVLKAVPGAVGAAAVSAYVDDVGARRFPSDEHCYRLEATELDRLYSLLASDG